jgi:hypothetical protein
LDSDNRREAARFRNIKDNSLSATGTEREFRAALTVTLNPDTSMGVKLRFPDKPTSPIGHYRDVRASRDAIHLIPLVARQCCLDASRIVPRVNHMRTRITEPPTHRFSRRARPSRRRSSRSLVGRCSLKDLQTYSLFLSCDLSHLLRCCWPCFPILSTAS